MDDKRLLKLVLKALIAQHPGVSVSLGDVVAWVASSTAIEEPVGEVAWGELLDKIHQLCVKAKLARAAVESHPGYWGSTTLTRMYVNGESPLEDILSMAPLHRDSKPARVENAELRDEDEQHQFPTVEQLYLAPAPPAGHKTANRIFYGPPGTGKTYRLARETVSLIDGRMVEDAQARKRFRELVQEGRIEQVTFHPSYSYEDFIEGLRPVVEGGQVNYRVESGAFKRIVRRATEAYLSGDSFEERWRILKHGLESEPKAVGGYVLRHEDDESIRFEISQGADEPLVLDHEVVLGIWNLRKSGVELEVDSLMPVMKRQHQDKEIVRVFSSALRSLMNVLDEIDVRSSLDQFVILIDEINRGDIPKIFGELITLLEPSKRLGMDEATVVTLPQSGEPFGVPPNLHVLGTMNTADRSISLMDLALRRRFQFVECPPHPSLVPNDLARRVMQAINQRIEFLLDRDHTLGHSRFMNITSETEEESQEQLRRVLVNDVIPLLQEYFYEDWFKIGLVLGCPFDDEGKGGDRSKHYALTVEPHNAKNLFALKDSSNLIDERRPIFSIHEDLAKGERAESAEREHLAEILESIAHVTPV
jgi:5-methylcytosine-specific restriction protein B